MNLRNWFVIPPRHNERSGERLLSGTPAAEGEVGTPVFITAQSLASFPGASIAVLIIWKSLDSLLPNSGLGDNKIVPFLASLLIGLIIYYLNLNDTMTRKERLVGGVIGFLNSLYLFLWVVGVPLAVGKNANDATSPPTPAPVATPGTAPSLTNPGGP